MVLTNSQPVALISFCLASCRPTTSYTEVATWRALNLVRENLLAGFSPPAIKQFILVSIKTVSCRRRRHCWMGTICFFGKEFKNIYLFIYTRKSNTLDRLNQLSHSNPNSRRIWLIKNPSEPWRNAFGNWRAIIPLTFRAWRDRAATYQLTIKLESWFCVWKLMIKWRERVHRSNATLWFSQSNRICHLITFESSSSSWRSPLREQSVHKISNQLQTLGSLNSFRCSPLDPFFSSCLRDN